VLTGSSRDGRRQSDRAVRRGAWRGGCLPKRASVELRRVALDHVAQLTRLVEEDAVRAHALLGALERLAEVVPPWVPVIELLIHERAREHGRHDEHSEGESTGAVRPAERQPSKQHQSEGDRRHEVADVEHVR
jgi:hypothetical protein